MSEPKDKIIGKILIVDDQEDNLKSLNQQLNSLAADIYTARSGGEALALLLRHHFAIVLVDVQMPDMDGVEMATIMRQSEELKLVPIIFISDVQKEQEYVFKGYEKGAVDYIIKPVEPVILRHKVKLFLELDAQREKLRRLHEQTQNLLQQITNTVKQNKQLLDSSSEGIIGYDPSGLITFVNKQAIALLKQSEKQILGRQIQDFLISPKLTPAPSWESSPMNKAMLDNRQYRISSGYIWRHDGSDFPVDYGCSPIYNEENDYVGGVMTFQDITIRKMAEEQLIHIAQYDELTDLANRDLFASTLSKSLLHAQRNGRTCGVLFLDLDNFKKINDSMGHAAGDDLLISIAGRLKDAIREDDLPARFGGDEFAVLLSDLARTEDAMKVAENILKAMQKTHLLQGEDVRVSFSIGIATYPECGSEASALMKAADIAMYHAKQKGKNNFQFFSQQMQLEAERRLIIETELKKALKNDEFILVYQPQIDAQNGQIVGVEALIRWENEILGQVAPSEFIPIAEESGLVCDISRWVIETVYRQYKAWQDSTQPFYSITLAINMSLVKFVQTIETVHEKLCSLMDKTGEQTEKPLFSGIYIEINEMALKNSPTMNAFNVEEAQAVSEALHHIHNMGLKISIDDFGTGGMSLSNLMQMPVEVLKIDTSFIDGIGRDEMAESIIRYTIQFAHDLGIQVIAEGVENQAQVDFLQKHGCDYLQGYHLSAPLQLAELEKLPQTLALN
jgi:diguanylate cyclase (GGDEF)-like protein/PAS domain S-box-containing protein